MLRNGLNELAKEITFYSAITIRIVSFLESHFEKDSNHHIKASALALLKGFTMMFDSSEYSLIDSDSAQTILSLIY